MRLNVKTTNIQMTPAISGYLDKRLSAFDKFISPNDQSVKCDVEIGKTTRHHRLRFAIETIEATKEAVGEDFPIIFRLSGDELMEGGLKIRANVEIAHKLAKVGVDAFHVSPGWHESKTPIMV